MPSEADTDSSTGIYKCTNISSMKIKVHLKTIKSSSIPLTGLQEDVQDDKVEEVKILWQERVFSPWELTFYGDIVNCKSTLHKDYNKRIQERSNDENCNKNIIFTYTSEDIASNPEKEVLQSGFKFSTYLHEAMKLQLYLRLQSDTESEEVPKSDIIDFYPSLQKLLKNRKLTVKKEFMYIMADIGYLTDGQVNEKVLVTLKWEPSMQVLTVFPDFNNSLSEPGYTLEGLSDACYQYVYWVTCSKSKETKRMLDFIIEEKLNQQIIPSVDIIVPRHGLLHVYIFGEIKSANHFEDDNLFINYCLELPAGWSSSSELSGVTHRSNNVNGTCVFGHLFEFHLKLNFSAYENYETFPAEAFPQMLLEVVSLDNWGRVSREGCGWVRFVPIAGHRIFTIHTWRPVSTNSRINAMKRFFIGATAHSSDMTYFGVPKSFIGTNLSRFGFETISSGTVKVDLNIVIQSQDASNRSSRTCLLERLSTTSLMKSVSDALKKFTLARQRFLKVTAPLSLSN